MNQLRESNKARRVQCPFYGFAWPAATHRLLQMPGNQCGLALDRVEPCRMETAGEAVDIDLCPAAITSGQFIRMASPVIVFLTPEHPEGLSYPDWLRYVCAKADS